MSNIRWFNTHIVDLTKTPWDKEKSNPSKGEFVFTGPKVYFKRGDGSPWRVGFLIRYTPPYRELSMMEFTMQTTPIKAADCLAFPEGLRPNELGYYQFDDVILAKEPKMHYLKRREAAVKGTDEQIKSEKGGLVNEGSMAGSKVDFYEV
jgi:hypothetical protein